MSKDRDQLLNLQARFIVERLRQALPTISAASIGSCDARERISVLERALGKYDEIVNKPAAVPKKAPSKSRQMREVKGY